MRPKVLSKFVNGFRALAMVKCTERYTGAVRCALREAVSTRMVCFNLRPTPALTVISAALPHATRQRLHPRDELAVHITGLTPWGMPLDRLT